MCIPFCVSAHLLQRLRTRHFCNRKNRSVFVCERPDTLQKFRNIAVGLIVNMLLQIKRPRNDSSARIVRRIIPEIGIKHRKIQCIQSKPVYTSVQPETGGLQQGILHGGMMNIQLWLAWQEIMHVILLTARVPCP